ncbi:hypothetical protein DEO72_LG10g2280 [Vigna unguiculata]|uniref:Uncharacterized protein n=1 Tax=Vigna unguiculata TaxID=3917 RepID=A0A4D6NGH7_VIGUN|nr:hypothetical protein DEO72_LG10g2280 [Vigna unguiculata]
MADFWQRDDAEKTRRSGNGGLRLMASWFCELWRLIRAGARWCCKGGSGNTTVKMVTVCMKDVGGCCSGEVSGGLRTWHTLIGYFSKWRIAMWRNLVKWRWFGSGQRLALGIGVKHVAFLECGRNGIPRVELGMEDEHEEPLS